MGKALRVKILPTLNIRNGRVIPVVGSDPQEERSPLDVVDTLLEQGCSHFALVDVDAALNQGNNRELLGTVMHRIQRSHSRVCIQVGGGICNSDLVQHFLDLGATWVLLGTVLHRYPTVVDHLLARFREHLTASVDSRGGEVQAFGQRKPQGLQAWAMAERIRDSGFKRILFVDIPVTPSAEPDFQTAKAVCEHTHIPVFMGGSIRSLDHLAQAKRLQGLQGVFIDALQILNSPEMIAAPASPCA